MTKLKIKFLAVRDSRETLINSAISRIEKQIKPDTYLLTDSNPDILYFLTGGTERMATEQVSKGEYYLLVGSKHNNSYASATEVKAYLNEINIPAKLIDEKLALSTSLLHDFFSVKRALKNLRGKKLGLIGEVSDWLINSDISSDVLYNKLGINLKVIPWSEVTHFSKFKTSESFINTFSHQSTVDLSETGKVNESLVDVIKSMELDAITVECFSMVQKEHVTACLPLAKLNNDGIPAGCEGDLTAIAGMMLCKELTGIIPWMANINKATDEVCMFSHCTIAPNLVSDFSIKSHFETGIGTAIQGDFKEDLVTLFRFDKHLKKIFIATGNITGRPKSKTACRTQIEVKLPENDVLLLKNNPLGNHHLIYPGDCKKLLKLACEFLDIEIIK